MIYKGGEIMNSNMYIIKKSNKIIYHLYLSKSGGICYRLYSLHQNQQVDPFEVSITDERILEFHACCDEEDNIHIIALTENGDLKYIINKDNTWDIKTFFHFDLRSNIVKSVFIHVIGNIVFIIYAASNIMNVNLWTIYFKTWNGSKWANSSIGITICDKESAIYHLAIEHQNNFHIFYKNFSNKGTQIYYRKFHSQFSLWSTPEKVISIPEAIPYYYVFCDNKNQLHLVWTTASNIGNNHYKILYKRVNTKVLNNNKPQYVRVVPIDSSNEMYGQPVIFEIEQRIWVLWKMDSEFFGCEMDISGLSHGPISNIHYSGKSTPVLVQYINNCNMEIDSFNGNLLYGICEDYVNLILPKPYTCEYFNEIPSQTNDIEPPQEERAFEDSINENMQLENTQDKQKKSDPVPDQNELSLKLYHELKSENEKLENMILELKNQLNNNEILSVLTDIKTQNKEFAQLIYQFISQNNAEQALLKSKSSKKIFGFFNKSS